MIERPGLLATPVAVPELATMIEIVVPVHNEEVDLEASVRRLDGFVAEGFPYSVRITIADNASTDRTWPIAQRLAEQLPRVRAVRLERKGRGHALKAAWSASAAPILVYLDVDLSTDLRALLPLVAPLISGHSDLAIGTRLSRSSRVVRGPKREFISRSYNLILKGTLAASFSDAQCGFKAIRASVAAELLPLIEDDNWFFDTELLVLAQRAGLRIYEVPVDWIDDLDSRVDVLATAREDLAGIVRLAKGFARGTTLPGVPRGLLGQLIRFGGVGVLSTLAYLIALVITAVANTAANRRLTFGVRGSGRLILHHAGGLIAFVVGLLLTSGSLWLLHATLAEPPRGLEIAVLVLANAMATLVRFLSLRQLMGRHRSHE
jgi:glycosyltransferase involved in cell wall biosynthesis